MNPTGASHFRPEIWSDEVLDQAVAWHVELTADGCNSDVEDAWEHWYQSCASHRQAWAQLQSMNHEIQQVNRVGRRVIQQADQQQRQRRQLLKGLLGLSALSPVLWWLPRTAVWRAIDADIATAAGEQRKQALPDGSQLWLNTQTQVNLHFSPEQRTIELLGGEIYLQTAKDSRPLQVLTSQGRVRALGTAFSVKQKGTRVDVVLEKGEVEVQTRESAQQLRLLPGQQTRFDARQLDPVRKANLQQLRWRDGMLIVQDWSLLQFCIEVERYLPGKLYCADAVAELRISGSFPLRDPQALVMKLPKILPVQVQTYSKYWLAISAKQ